jgi:hypothetical protein
MNNNIFIIDKPKYILVKKSLIKQEPILILKQELLVIDKPKYILVKKSLIKQEPILIPKQEPILKPKKQNNGRIFKYDREMYHNFHLI